MLGSHRWELTAFSEAKMGRLTQLLVIVFLNVNAIIRVGIFIRMLILSGSCFSLSLCLSA